MIPIPERRGKCTRTAKTNNQPTSVPLGRGIIYKAGYFREQRGMGDSQKTFLGLVYEIYTPPN